MKEFYIFWTWWYWQLTWKKNPSFTKCENPSSTNIKILHLQNINKNPSSTTIYLISTYNKQFYKAIPRGLWLVDYVYICGNKSNDIHRLSPDGTFRDIVLSEHDGVDQPFGIAFNNDFTKLFIINKTKTVLVYSCRWTFL
jgi:hypothetical protein